MDDRAERQRELARIYLEKAHQDLVWVEPVGDSAEIADEIIGFHIHHRESPQGCVDQPWSRVQLYS